MPRRTIEVDALLRLRIRNPGQRNVEYTAELFIDHHDKDRIRELILATGLDAVNLLDIRDKPNRRWNQPNPKAL